MGLLDRGPRRSPAALLPWAALVLVSLFALVQVRARSRLADELAAVREAGRSAPAPEVPASALVAGGALPTSLPCGGAGGAAWVEARTDRLGGWLADAAGPDLARRAEAARAAAEHGAALLGPLIDRLQAQPDLATAQGVLRLAPHLPSGVERSALLVAAALRVAAEPAPAAAAQWALVDALRGDGAALEQALRSEALGLVELALRAVGSEGEPLSAAQRARACERLLARVQGAATPPVVLRALGVLRWPAAWSVALALLEAEPWELAGAAAWCLARTLPAGALGGSEALAARAQAVDGALRLLAAPEGEARAAGLALAEALLARRLAPPADAPAAQRAADLAALEALLRRWRVDPR